MSATLVYGFGGVRIGCENNFASFETAKSDFLFEPIFNQMQMLSGKIVKEIKGYRAKISVLIYNAKAGDWQKIRNLFSFLNSNQEISIEPKFSSSLNPLKFENCILQGNISFKDLANFKCGQSIVLDFVTSEIYPEIPFCIDVYSFGELTDSTELNINDSSLQNLSTVNQGE